MTRTLKTCLSTLLTACLLTLLPAAFAEESLPLEAPLDELEAAVDEVPVTLGDDSENLYDIEYDIVSDQYDLTEYLEDTTSEPVEVSDASATVEDRIVKITLKSGHEPTRTYDGTSNCGSYDADKNYLPLLTHDDFQIDGVADGDAVVVDDNYLRGLKFDGKDAGDRTVSVNLAGHLKVTSSQYNYTVSSDSVTTIRGAITKKILKVSPPEEQSVSENQLSDYTIAAMVSGLLSVDKNNITGKLGYEGGNSIGRHRITLGTLSAGNNYEIDLEEGYLIITAPINFSDVTLSSIPDQQYTGNPITPDITLKYGDQTLVKDVDYELIYANNVNAGTATITITGKDKYDGTRVASFRIVRNDSGEDSSSSSGPVWLVPEHRDPIGIKETLHLQGMVSPDHPEISDKNWKWTSSNNSIATVKIQNRGALVTGKKAGTATITATTPDKKYTATYTVEVIDKQAPTSVKISGGSVVGVKEKLQMSAVMTAIGTPKSKLTWKSSDKKVATVSNKGLVTGKKAGTVTITVTTANKLSHSITIEVKDATAPTSVTLSPAGPRTIGLKDKLQLTAALEPVGTAKSKLKWATSDKKVATVSAKGLVTGKKAGRAIITVTTDNKLTASVEIVVEDIHAPTTVAIQPASPAPISVKGKLQLTASLTAIGTPKSKLKWTSSDKKIATVSAKGLVTGKKPGKATITVTTDNKLTASVEITVK